MSNTILQGGLMASLNIKMWTGSKKDEEAESVVSGHFGSSKESGNFTKKLISSPELDKLKQIAQSARAAHMLMTFPFDDQGYRYLPSTKYFDYVQKMGNLSSEFDSAVQDFLGTYDAAVLSAKTRLGRMFKDAEYPDVTTIAKKFSMKHVIQPIPTSVDNELVNELQGKLDDINDERSSLVRRSAWSRMLTKMSELQSKLSVQDAVFRDTLVTNVVDYIETLQELQVFHDNNMKDFLENVQQDFDMIDIDALRKDKSYRKKYADIAQKYVDLVAENA